MKMKTFIAALCLVPTVAITGCTKEEPKAGDAIKQAGEKADEAAKKAGEATKDAANKAGDAVNKATEKK